VSRERPPISSAVGARFRQRRVAAPGGIAVAQLERLVAITREAIDAATGGLQLPQAAYGPATLIRMRPPSLPIATLLVAAMLAAPAAAGAAELPLGPRSLDEKRTTLAVARGVSWTHIFRKRRGSTAPGGWTF
jgi:hypothetical protein